MRLESVRELKQQVLGGEVAPPAAVALESGRAVPVRGLIGVAPWEDGGFRLAVRLTEQDDALRAWAAAVAEQARGEVDVRVVGPITALGHARPTAVVPAPEDLQGRVRPLRRGVSIAHRDVTAGTLGAFVTREGQDRPLVLSNSHVLALSGSAEPGDAVLQPGPADGGTEDDRVGELLADVPFEADRPNLVDAAIAVLDEGVEIDPAGGDGPLSGAAGSLDPDAVDLREGVQKIGRTTGVTTGRITAFEVDAVPVGYGSGVLTFDEQVEFEGDGAAFSAGGDSGSVICTRSSRIAVALLFAGSATGGPSGTGLTYGNAMPSVLSALDVSLVTG